MWYEWIRAKFSGEFETVHSFHLFLKTPGVLSVSIFIFGFKRMYVLIKLPDKLLKQSKGIYRTFIFTKEIGFPSYANSRSVKIDISYQGSGLKQVNYLRHLMSLTIFLKTSSKRRDETFF